MGPWMKLGAGVSCLKILGDLSNNILGDYLCYY